MDGRFKEKASSSNGKKPIQHNNELTGYQQTEIITNRHSKADLRTRLHPERLQAVCNMGVRWLQISSLPAVNPGVLLYPRFRHVLPSDCTVPSKLLKELSK